MFTLWGQKHTAETLLQLEVNRLTYLVPRMSNPRENIYTGVTQRAQVLHNNHNYKITLLARLVTATNNAIEVMTNLLHYDITFSTKLWTVYLWCNLSDFVRLSVNSQSFETKLVYLPSKFAMCFHSAIKCKLPHRLLFFPVLCSPVRILE